MGGSGGHKAGNQSPDKTSHRGGEAHTRAEPSGPAPHAERSRPSPRAQALGAGVGKVSLYNAWFSVGLNFVNSENYQGLTQNFKTRWAEFWDS